MYAYSRQVRIESLIDANASSTLHGNVKVEEHYYAKHGWKLWTSSQPQTERTLKTNSSL